MDQSTPSYHGEFLRSPHHAALGLLTLGLGFLSASLLPLIVGVAAYAIGWIYLPDMRFFQDWVDRRRSKADRAAEANKVADFVRRRDARLATLSTERRARYMRLAGVCRDIETAGTDSLGGLTTSSDANFDPRLRRLDELMWTYLRLLGIEEALDQFLETERRETVPTLVKDAEAEANRLTAEVEVLKTKGTPGQLETRQRYLGSRLERLEVLRKRLQRADQAASNMALAISEQERLDQQIKLLRADAVASKNAETLTARIDATVEHLDQTNKWLAEMDEFKDLAGDLPPTDARLGYEPNAQPVPAPPQITNVPAQSAPRPQPTRQAQR